MTYLNPEQRPVEAVVSGGVCGEGLVYGDVLKTLGCGPHDHVDEGHAHRLPVQGLGQRQVTSLVQGEVSAYFRVTPCITQVIL